MPTITSSGVGSGLNVSSLVSQLVAAERAPYDARISRADTRLTTEFTALAQLKGAMSSLQGTVSTLKKADDFLVRKATLSDSDHFAATTTSAAAPGNYDVEVRALAKVAQLGSAAVVGGASASVGTGTLTIAMGASSFSVTLATGADTLADLRDAINDADDNPGVNAALVTDVDGTHLVLSGTATGAANTLRITTTGGSGGLTQFVHDPPTTTTNMRVLSTAQDAQLFVAGYEIHDADNTIDGAIEGVTLTLKKAETGVTTSLAVEIDGSAIRDRANSFVNSYNVLANQISKLRSYNPETKVAGPLLGDSMLRGLESQLRRMLSEPVAGATEPYTSLASVGITTTVAGTLTLDATRFDAAMAKDPTAVSKLFTTADSGLAVRMHAFLTAKLDTGSDLATRDARITSNRKALGKQQEALEARMTQIQARYLKQFNALDSLLTQMQSTSTYLSQQLSNSSG
jgi:flagellar hook-associated protein 2